MHSPLPDASALEAGILEDETPSRLSRVQDNVRHLLRTSVFNSVHSSPQASPTRQYHHQPYIEDHGLPTPPESPIRRASPPSYPPDTTIPNPHTEIPLPTPSTTASSSSSSSPPATPPTSHLPDPVPGVLFPPASYRQRIQHMAHQSALFNTRAVAALNHPDLSDSSLATYLQLKAESRQRHAWKRSRHGRGRGHHGKREVAARAGSSQYLLCVLAALLLAAVVATYLVLATTSTHTTATFHILFVLGILLATIVFAHTLVRLCLFSNGSRREKRKVLVIPVASRSKHHHHQHRHHRRRGLGEHQDLQLPHAMPALSNDNEDFVPPTPIRVHMPIDEVQPDSRDVQPTATAEVESSSQWDKDIPETVANPPPAYGRWRGSVRANPELLHWQAVPSPVDGDLPVELPSPTYEEATRAALQTETGPPSYVTRESPARRHELRDGERALSQAVEPEMVEVRGMGLAM